MSKADPWAGIKPLTMKRVDARGRYGFFWAAVEKGSPALVLYTDGAEIDNAGLPRLKNIDLRVRILDKEVLIMSLLDGSHREIFETLCLDVIGAAEQADNIQNALDRAVRRMRRWHLLLKGGTPRTLSLEEQRGLVGELAFLRTLVSKIGPSAAVEGWKGPDGSAKDFEFPKAYIEVKARRGAAKPFVKISSEDQLSDVGDASLFLRVYDVDSAILPDGLILTDHVEQTRAVLEHSPSALDAFDTLVASTGYDDEDDYGERRWIVGAERTYEVVDGFPRIITPVPEGVSGVTYYVSLDACRPFETTTDPAAFIGKK